MLALVLHGEMTSDPNLSAASANYVLQHYGPETYNKNFIYSGDSWLFVERWEHLIANRAQLDMVEVLTWSTLCRVMILVLGHRNLRFRYLDDYGESHYIGPIEGAQPMSEAWVNGFDHQGICSLNTPRFRPCLSFAHVGPGIKRLARPPTVLHIRIQKRRLP